MKKIFLSLFIFIISFMFVSGVSADDVKVTCEYNNYKFEFIEEQYFVYYKNELVDEEYAGVVVTFIPKNKDQCPNEVYIGEVGPGGSSKQNFYASKDLKDKSIHGLQTYKLTSSSELRFEDNNSNNSNNSNNTIYDNYESGEVSCGNKLIENIPSMVPRIVSILYNVIQVAVPVLLVIMGMFDFAKAMSAGKEEDIKKNQKLFIKRLISGILIFCVFVIVKFIVSIVADSSSVMECADCFISGNCDTKVIQ